MLLIMDEKYMKIALQLASKGAGFVTPNPLVGAVIVKHDRIIGKGYHMQYGKPHAEVNAINNCVADPKGATMYVTLEPCSHFGKTPPCADLIIKSGIKKVVVSMQDPNPLVCGNGIKKLTQNGIEVTVGVLAHTAKKQNEIFIKYITTGKPFCILKTAMTLDGKIATCTGDSKWITNQKSRDMVHKIRHKVSAIMVGIGTVIKDNPLLTTRIKNGVNPIRIVVDSTGKIPINSNILNDESKTIIATTDKIDPSRKSHIESTGAEVLIIRSDQGRVSLPHLFEELGKRKIDSVLLEGGASLNASAIKAGIVDKVICFIAPKILGGSSAPTPIGGDGIQLMKDAINLREIEYKKFEDDIMIEGMI